ncbi:MAG TPA: methyltransferase domain-containing protein [Anaerolineales bacterium]|nr:methyltransferase domain-containing protein [Anaerolineales bacterium]
MLTIEMVEIMCCPTCKQSDLRAEIVNQVDNRIEEGLLICDNCHNNYPVQDGVPNLIPQSALNSDEWSIWKQHLERFQARRDFRKKSAVRLRPAMGKKLSRAFFDFAKITEGNVLDVGCGPGKLRAYLDEEQVKYYGMDPLPTPDIRDFRFVFGLAEHIPFKDSTFENILVISALDHFNNIHGFFEQAVRVLKPDGRFHLFQSTHEAKSPTSMVKVLGHIAKDAFDNMKTRKRSVAPKHMTEFKKLELLEHARGYFEIVSLVEYSGDWYTPDLLFVSMQPLSKIQKTQQLIA